MAGPSTPARRVAHAVLSRVEQQQAFAERALHAQFARSALSDRDKALATELVYGTLRHKRALDARLDQYLQQPCRTLPHPVQQALRLGAYQLLHTRIPAHSAVDEAVRLVRRRFGRLAGVVNAVLRRLAKEATTQPDHVPSEDIAALAERYSHPDWLVAQMLPVLGPNELQAWLEANNQAAPLSLRVCKSQTTREAVYIALQQHRDAQTQINPWTPCNLTVRRAGDVRALPGFQEGLLTVQDAAASLIGLWADPKPGQVILDACAAPGGKSTHLAELVGPTGRVIATDIHPGKRCLIQDNAARLHLENIFATYADARDTTSLAAAVTKACPEATAPPMVDMVVLDAPCSGMGTLRRNPERRQRPLAQVQELVTLQAEMLDAVVPLIRPGGTLLYVLCTPTLQEGPAQIEDFCHRHPDFELIAPTGMFAPFADGPYLRTWTHRHGMDSFFAAKMHRRATACDSQAD